MNDHKKETNYIFSITGIELMFHLKIKKHF